MKVILGLLALLLVLIAGYVFLQRNPDMSIPFLSPTPTVTINDATFKLSVADDPQERSRGLSNRDTLPEDYGMLFTFDQEGLYRFWMKNMKFPLDIIYIRDGKVVDVFSDVEAPKPSDGNPQVIIPSEPADRVLEINAGKAKEYDITKDDVVTFTNV